MKANNYLTTLFNTVVYTFNNGDIFLKVAGTLHHIGTTAHSVDTLQKEAGKYIYTV